MSQKISLLFILICVSLYSQESPQNQFFVDGNYFYGSLLRHNKNIAQLIHEHPDGFVVSFNVKTNGEKYWQQVYNYPDWGFSFLHEDYNYEYLGKNYGLLVHYNFYFLNRNLQFKIGQGVSYTTNPFDINDNFKNIAHGSTFLATTYLSLKYHKPYIIGGFGLQAGASFIHNSNGSFKAPNSGTNVLALIAGVNYNIDEDYQSVAQKDSIIDNHKWKDRIRYNLALRGGVNESDYYNLGQHPFYIFSVSAEKRVSFKSILTFGSELFISKFLEKEIEYVAAAFPTRGVTGNEDYKRVGVFAGHEFMLHKLGIVTQAGYYVYSPYSYESDVYFRIGVKYHFTKELYADATLKTHAANAEAIEFGLGISL